MFAGRRLFRFPLVAAGVASLSASLLQAGPANDNSPVADGVCAANAAAPQADGTAAKRHPLTGTVVDCYGDRSALLVKHEAIPGVMRAMKMVFKVDPAVLETVRKGDRISALMYRDGDEWRLEQVKRLESP